MRTKLLLALTLATLLGLVPAGAARADDTDLLKRFTPAPNVLIVLDTSQSMAWWRKDGESVGDELCYPAAGSTCPPPDLLPQNLPQAASRMWMAKWILSMVVTANGDKIRFGLASYDQGTAATNVKVQATGVGSPRSWYYSEGSYKLPTSLFGGAKYTIGNRYYPDPYYFDLRVPQAGLGGPANPADPAGYNPATLRPNLNSGGNSYSGFTLTWALRTDVTPNPKREKVTGQAYVAPTPAVTHPEPRCRYIKQRANDPDDNFATPPPGPYANFGGTWDTPVAAVPPLCPAAGTITVPPAFTAAVTVTKTCTFSQRVTYDTPTPYEYACKKYTNGVFSGNLANEYFQNDPGAPYTSTLSFTSAYWEQTKSLGHVTINVVDVPGSPGQAFIPDKYRWTYYYDAACQANCKNAGKFWSWTWSTPYYIGDRNAPTYGFTDCKADLVNDPYVDPPAMGLPACGSPWAPRWSPNPTGTWVVPVHAEYKWTGNNYSLLTETSCPPSGVGARALVDVASGNQDAIKNYLGTGPDPTKELHGANRSTPLAASLEAAYFYFTNTVPANGSVVVQTDAQKDCRKHYVILLTDGGESCLIDLTVPGQKAAALAAISPPTLPSGVKTYVVGIDQNAFSNDELTVLNDTAVKGLTARTGSTNKFYEAKDPKALLDALLAIIGSILSDQYAFVPPVVPSLRSQDNLMLVQGSFSTPPDPNSSPPPFPPSDPNTPFWQGQLEAFDLSSTGTVQMAGPRIDPNTRLWQSHVELANTAGSTRSITTFVGGAQVPLKKSPPNAALQAALIKNAPDVTGDLVIDSQDADAIIDAVRGPAPGQKGFLGDIGHSVPAIVGPPSPTYVDRTFDPADPTKLLSLGAAPDTFAGFRNAQKTRQRVAIVGTNAGLLHAFNAGTYNALAQKYDRGDGKEVWAFVPPQMLPKLWYLAVVQGHQYYVDGSPKVADVWLDLNSDGVKDSTEWHTVLIGGFRQGGKGLFSLGITNTTTPYFGWTYPPTADPTDPDPSTGESWSEPAIGKVKVQMSTGKVDRWVAIVGDGYDPTWTSNAVGRKVHIIDIQTGKALWQYATSAPVAASPLALDVDNDTYLDRVYVGTIDGKILRLDISALGTNSSGNVDPANGVMVDNWSVGVFFEAGPAQPFFTKGAATQDAKGNLWFFIGSGDRADPMSIQASAPYNRLYGMKDPYAGAPIAALTEGDLKDMTLTNSLMVSDLSGKEGWFIVLSPGEKEWAETALVFNSQVFFTTFTPGATACGDVGNGTIYMVYYLTGGGVTDTVAFQNSQPSSRTYQVNAGATSRPVVTTGSLGANAVVYLSNTDMLTLTPTFTAPSSIRATRYWIRIP